MEQLAEHRRRGGLDGRELLLVQPGPRSEAIEVPAPNRIGLTMQEGDRITAAAGVQPGDVPLDLAIQLAPQPSFDGRLEDPPHPATEAELVERHEPLAEPDARVDGHRRWRGEVKHPGRPDGQRGGVQDRLACAHGNGDGIGVSNRGCAELADRQLVAGAGQLLEQCAATLGGVRQDADPMSGIGEAKGQQPTHFPGPGGEDPGSVGKAFQEPRHRRIGQGAIGARASVGADATPEPEGASEELVQDRARLPARKRGLVCTAHLPQELLFGNHRGIESGHDLEDALNGVRPRRVGLARRPDGDELHAMARLDQDPLGGVGRGQRCGQGSPLLGVQVPIRREADADGVEIDAVGGHEGWVTGAGAAVDAAG